MKLIFVRHGRTEWNDRWLLQGTTDIPLNETGLRQAEEASRLLRDTPFDRAVTSPLSRARQTAEILCRDRGIVPEEDARIREQGFGPFEGTLFDRERFDSWWAPGFDCEAIGIESPESVYRRVAEALEELRLRYPRETILMVSHGGVSVAVRRWFGEDTGSFVPNCTPMVFEKE